MTDKLEHWRQQVKKWQASGLSAAAWCRAQELPYWQLLYWRQRIEAIHDQGFIEIRDADPSEGTGVEIQVRKLTIRLSKGFDAQELARCLEALGV